MNKKQFKKIVQLMGQHSFTVGKIGLFTLKGTTLVNPFRKEPVLVKIDWVEDSPQNLKDYLGSFRMVFNDEGELKFIDLLSHSSANESEYNSLMLSLEFCRSATMPTFIKKIGKEIRKYLQEQYRLIKEAENE